MPLSVPRVVVGSVLLALAASGSALASSPSRAEENARRLANEQKWPEAERAFAALVAQNPYDDSLWRRYGFVLHSEKRYDEAIAAWKKALELGCDPKITCYAIACAEALAGRSEAAIEWVGKALDRGLVEDEILRTDTDIASIRSLPKFRELVGLFPPEGLSRDEKWRYDLRFFRRRMEQVHFDLFAKVSREAFDAELASLSSDVPKLTEAQIRVRLRKLVASVGDGHTMLLSSNPGWRYPVDLYRFSDGMFVRGASAEHAAIVGGRVERIGTKTLDEAVAAVTPLCSIDNAMGLRAWPPILLTVPEILEGLGIVPDGNHATIVVRTLDGETHAAELTPAQHKGIGYGFASEPGFVYANARATAPLPLYLAGTDVPFRFEWLPERKLLYFQWNKIYDSKDETLEAFAGRLFEFAAKNGAERLVIDLRANGGGDTSFAPPVIRSIVRSDALNQPGHLYVIIGRLTFSAAMNTAVMLEHWTNATFVGEPTGSSPNFVGETTILVGPCTRTSISCSSRQWQMGGFSDDHRRWIPPALCAELSSRDFADNRDPAMEAIFADLR
jgi:hypothetical protein